MPCLSNLAPELIQQIGNDLGKDVASLRLTSKHLSLVLEPQILHSIAIYILKDRLEPGLSLLKTLALSGGNHRATTATHNLIVALCPLSDYTSSGPAHRWDSERGLWVSENVPEDPVEAKLAEEQMKEMLQPAIASLKNLRSIRWSICLNDSKWAQSAVMEAVKSLQNLESFHLDLAGSITDIQLGSLRNLKKIAITGYCDNFISTIVEPLTVAITNSPHLSSLEFGPRYLPSGPAEFSLPTLHQLLKHDALQPPVHLKSLNIRCCCVRLDRTTLPHLRHLTSLTLVSIIVGASSIPDDDPIKAECSTHDEIWYALNKSGIHLHDISVDHVGRSFLDYMSSYSGLKKIHVLPRNFLNGLESDIFAARFYERLLHHVESLEELDVEPPYEGRWCLVDLNLATLCQCPRLRVLKSGIVSHMPNSDDTNLVKTLIDTVVSQIPSLKELGILAVNNECNRGSSCGNPGRKYLQRVATRLAVGIMAYRPSGTVTRLPMVQAGWHTGGIKHYFAKPSEGSSGTLAYECVTRINRTR